MDKLLAITLTQRELDKLFDALRYGIALAEVTRSSSTETDIRRARAMLSAIVAEARYQPQQVAS